jgi:hypothetical protein
MLSKAPAKCHLAKSGPSPTHPQFPHFPLDKMRAETGASEEGRSKLDQSEIGHEGTDWVGPYLRLLGPTWGSQEGEVWGAPAVAAVALVTVRRSYLKTWLRYCWKPKLPET